jgi:hypothetical protein
VSKLNNIIAFKCDCGNPLSVANKVMKVDSDDGHDILEFKGQVTCHKCKIKHELSSTIFYRKDKAADDE